MMKILSYIVVVTESKSLASGYQVIIEQKPYYPDLNHTRLRIYG